MGKKFRQIGSHIKERLKKTHVRIDKKQIIKLIFLGVIVFPLFYWFLTRSGSMVAAWYDLNWQYRKPVTITHSGGATVTDYQVLVTVDTATLISASKMQSDCDDIRFTNSSDALLDYSIVEPTCNTSATQIWVQVDSITSSGATIYMYYGYSGASGVSSEANTFSYSSEKTVGYVLDSTVNNLRVISLSANNSITHNGVTRSLGVGQTAAFTSISQFGAVTAKGLFNADDDSDDTDMLVPVSWAGTEFLFRTRSTTTSTFYAIAPWQQASINISSGATTNCSSQTVATTGSTINCSTTAGQNKITSDYPVIIFYEQGTTDPMPLHPSDVGPWYGAGNTTFVTSNSSGADYRYIYQSSGSETNPADLGANAAATLSGGSGFGASAQKIRSTNNPIGLMQYGDGDGSDGHTFLPEYELGTRWGSSTTNTDYIAVAGNQSFSCTVYNSYTGGQIGTGSATSSNTSVYFLGFGTGNSNQYTAANWYMDCTEPVMAMYQKASNAESGLWTYPMMRQFTYPTPSVGSPGTEEGAPTATPTTNPATPTPFPNDLVGYWKSDEGYGTSIKDSSDRANTGSVSATSWQTDDLCVSGKCLLYNGTSSYATVPSSTSIQMANDNFTVSLWARSAGDTDGFLLIKRASEAAPAGYNLYVGSGSKVRFQISDGSNTVTSTPGNTNVSNNTWHHIVMVVNRTTDKGQLWIDGKQEGADIDISSVTGSLSNDTAIFVGKDDSNDTGFYSGFIDEIKIYNSAHSASQIKSEFNSRGGLNGASVRFGGIPENSLVLSNGLVGYWKLDEASGTRSDASGNGHTLSPDGTGVGSSAGQFGKSAQFIRSSGDYLTIDSSSAPELQMSASQSFTISGWMYPDTATSGDRVPIAKAEVSGNSREYYFVMNSGQLSFVISTDGGSPGVYCSTTWPGTMSAGAMYFVAGWYDAETQTSGIQVNDDDPVTASCVGPYQGTAPFRIGAGSNGGTAISSWDGKVDEVRVYRRYLTPDERSFLYRFAPGPIREWKLDENTGSTAFDTAGNGWTGTLATPRWSPGKYGSSLKFNGSSDYVGVGNTAMIEVRSGFTISAWVNAISSTGVQEVFAQGHSSNTVQGFRFGISSGTIGFSARNDADGGVIQVTGGNFYVNRWQHLAVTKYGSLVTLYLDGVNVGSTSAGPSGTYTFNTSTIGAIRRSNGTTEVFSGNIDDVRIYDYARTPEQILADMNAGHPAPGSPVGSSLAYWKFDEGYGGTLNSSISIGYTGTMGTGSSSPSWTGDGVYGRALTFDGSDDYVNLGNMAAYQPSNVTVSAWFNTSSSNGMAILRKRLGGYALEVGNGEGLPGQAAGKVTFWIHDGTNFHPVTSPTTYNDGKWHQATGTFDGSSLRIYVDGNLKASSTAPVSIYYGSGSVAIGRDGDTNGKFFSGSLDEVKIYNFALNSSEVKLEYNRSSSAVLGSLSTGAGGTGVANSVSRAYCVPGDTATCSPPVAEWNFEEGSGGSAYDTSGNGNTGAWSGSGSRYGPGKVGKGAVFNGTNDYVHMSDSTSLRPAALTVAAWFYYTTNNVDIIPIQKGNGVSDCSRGRSFALGMNWPAPIFTISDGSSYEYAGGYNITIPTNTWVYQVGTYDGSTLSLYYNGVLFDQKSTSLTISYSGYDMLIGGGNCDGSSTPSSFFNGRIDDVKVYNYARSAAQVAWDYNRGAPIQHWKFDENTGTVVRNSMGVGYTGALGSGGSAPSWNSTGKSNYSLTFDGVDDFVNIDVGSTYMPTGTMDISVSAWINASSLPSLGTILAYGGDDVNNGYVLKFNDGQPRFTVFNAANATDPLTRSTNTWYHVIGTYDHSNIKLYVNGQLAATTAFTSDIISASQLRIGQEYNRGRNFAGKIDEVKVWNYPLTPKQVQLDYNLGAAGRIAPVTGTP